MQILLITETGFEKEPKVPVLITSTLNFTSFTSFLKKNDF